MARRTSHPVGRDAAAYYDEQRDRIDRAVGRLQALLVEHQTKFEGGVVPMRVVVVLAVALILTACGGAAEQTAAPTERPTVEPTASFEPAAVDLELFFSIWKGAFADDGPEIFVELSDAIESDFYWIDSVDRVSYDEPAHRLTLDTTVSFESVYLNDPQEWRSDTWTLYLYFVRHAWTPFIEGSEETLIEAVEEDGGLAGLAIDWPRFLPVVLFNANGGRLAVECPGSLTYAIVQREATQTEFEAECIFTP